MSQWSMVPLGDVLQQDTTPTAVYADRVYPNFGIYSFGRGLFAKPPISGATTSAKTLYRVKVGQFIYSRLFAFEGAYGVVGEEFNECFISNEYPHFDCDAKRLNVKFLAAYLRWPKAWERAATLSTGMGDRRRRIQPEQLLRMEIPLPSLSEQQRIVEWLDAVETRVKEAHSEADTAVNRLDQLLASAFSEVSAGAPMRPMGEIAPLTRRPVEIVPEESYPELGVRCFGKGTFHKPPLSGADAGTKKLYAIEPSDIVFSNVFAWEGAIAVATAEDAGRFGSHRFITCVPFPRVATPRFVCYYFQQPEGLEKIRDASPGGAGRNRTLGLAKLEKLLVPVPSYEPQQWFDRLLEKVDDAKQVIQQARVERSAMLPAILNQVFSQEA